MVNQWIRADKLQPDFNKLVIISVQGGGMWFATYLKKAYGTGGYFLWNEHSDEDTVEDDLSRIAWRDAPDDYDWGCEA